MNCPDIIQKLPAYLANEVSPSERKYIQNHLASCADCQNELRVLAALQSRIRESLHSKAAESAPSPQAWSHLQARLSPSERSEQTISRLARLRNKQPNHQGVFAMKPTAYAALAVVIAIAAIVAFVPGVRAAVVENLTGWLGFEFSSPSGLSVVSLSTNWGFSPYNPRYIPDRLDPRGFMTGGDEAVDTLGICYQPEHRDLGDPFIVIRESHLDTPGILPPGESVNINGIKGVFDELSAGEIEWCLGPSPEELLEPIPARQPASLPTELPPDEPLTYDKALRLTYFVEDVKIEIFGPYSKRELLRIASSLERAQVGAKQVTPPASQP